MYSKAYLSITFLLFKSGKRVQDLQPKFDQNFPFFSHACNRCIVLHASGLPVLAVRHQSWRGSRVIMQLH
ncbi:hypothetical protein [Salmonella phage vB_Sal_PHB48]|nr:hypothetical protein [Salmonella phage vB_Sal_PHB48]